jgi:hypothetical protein
MPIKPLKFIHISKTGGQTIANVALEQAQIKWGMHDEEYGLGAKCHRAFPTLPTYLKDKYDWFTVVRNPYDRMVSEYNFSKLNIDINIFVWNKMWNLENGNMNDGYHFTEQYKYLDPNYNIHVLHYENLDENFNNLMKSYSLNIKLNKKINVSIKKASKKDLSLRSIQHINRAYAKDFSTFGYEMVYDVFT